MASEELKTVNELLDGTDLGGLTLQERRAFMAAAAAPPPAGTTVDAADADGVPAELPTGGPETMYPEFVTRLRNSDWTNGDRHGQR